jgi:hypothetical protein
MFARFLMIDQVIQRVHKVGLLSVGTEDPAAARIGP